jgi:Tol biopolymer transport system component
MKRLLVLAVAAIAVPAAVGSVGNGPMLFVGRSPVTGYNELFSRNPDGSQQTKLVAGVAAVSLSPDGGTIAFTAQNGVASRDVYVMNADGSNVRMLASSAVTDRMAVVPLAWFPDDVRLAYRLPNELRVVDVRSGEQLPVPEYLHGLLPRPEQWSPDGTQFAYEVTSAASRYPEIKVASTSSRAVRTLVDAGTLPTWSPDGRWIAYTLAGLLYVVSSEGGLPNLIGGSPLSTPNTAEVPHWSPDSSSIAFAATTTKAVAGRRERFGAFVALRDGSRQTLVRDNAHVSGWSPAGDALVVEPTDLIDGFDDPLSAVYLVRPDGRCLTYITAGMRFVGWLPNASPPTPFRCVDIVLDASVPPIAGLRGAPMTLRVTNKGTDVAHDVRVNILFNSTVRIVSGSRDCAVLISGTAVCRVATLEPGRSLTFLLLLRHNFGSRAPIESLAAAGAAEHDSDSYTNSVDTTTRIYPCWIAGTNSNETLRGSRKGEKICGLGGSDWIYGGAGDDEILGGPGSDVLFPGAGHDRVLGGDGNDGVFSQDGERDLIGCGRGLDIVHADRLDSVARDCEHVTRV